MEGDSVPDPRGVPNAVRWDAPGFYRSSEGAWELVVDQSKNQIIHFQFKSW